MPRLRESGGVPPLPLHVFWCVDGKLLLRALVVKDVGNQDIARISWRIMLKSVPGKEILIMWTGCKFIKLCSVREFNTRGAADSCYGKCDYTITKSMKRLPLH